MIVKIVLGRNSSGPDEKKTYEKDTKKQEEIFFCFHIL